MLVAGVKDVKKNVITVPSEDVVVAEENANVEWLRFVQGTRIQDRTQVKFEMMRLQIENESTWENLQETLSSRTETQERGQTRMIPIGMWLADIGDAYRLAVVYRWTWDKHASDLGYPMSRPTVPQL